METTETGAADYVYRFRSAKNLLERNELENLEIYFAAPEQLNDPLEGHIDVYWEGDEVIWRNLFKHYMNCAIYAFMLYVAAEKEHRAAKWNDLHIRNPLALGSLPQHTEIPARVFGHEIVGRYIGRISKTARRIGPNEIAAHLESIHPFVIHTIYLWHWEHAHDDFYLKAPDFSTTLDHTVARVQTAMQIMAQWDAACGEDFHKREEKYKLLTFGEEEVSLLVYYRNLMDLNGKNRTFIHNDFCKTYVLNLRTLMYPRWFAASFMESCNGEAMWAYYGDSHKGVCLKYKTTPDAIGKPSLRINTPCGVVGLDSDDIVYHYINHQFLPVTYETAHLELNFFDTLHAVTIPVLSSQWLRGREGHVSKFGNRSTLDASDWRSAYWQDARVSTSTKTPAWQAERERRLVYQSDGFNLDQSPQLRAMKYDFAALDGIIFGIRTPTNEKIQIMRIIEQKCRNAGRIDFNFYQAVQTRTGKIEVIRLQAISDLVRHTAR